MKKGMFKKLFTTSTLALSLIISSVFPAYASGSTQTDAYISSEETTFSSVIMNIGADETKRNITWYSNVNSKGEIRYAKKSEAEVSGFVSACQTSPAIAISTTKDGYYSYKATISGLEENTSYIYQLSVGENVSDFYNFDVKSFDNIYSFAVAGDPQVSTYGGPSWSDTLQKIESNFSDTSFIITVGDQTETPTSEKDYDNFIVPEVSSKAIAVTLGTAHDNAMPFKEHYNITNLSSIYGISETTSNYFYKYNNTLFIHLNIESSDMASHTEFVRRTVKNNPDCIWQVVVIHYSLYSGANYEKETNFRQALSPVFTQEGIDAVFSGHHHFYARSELMSDYFTVSNDEIIDNTVTNPEGVVYIDAGPSTTASGFSDGSGIGSDYTLNQDFESRKKIVTVNVSETSFEINAYYVDNETPELFDTFTIYRDAEKVRLNKNTDMLEITEDGNLTRAPLVNAYAYNSATIRVVDGSWAISTDDEASYTSLNINLEDTNTILNLNSETGNWELSEDSGETFKDLPININKYKVTYVTDANASGEIDLSDYPTHTVSASELPDAPVLSLPQGSIEEGYLYEWSWKYCDASTGEETKSFSAGNEYIAYLVCNEMQVSTSLSIANTTSASEGIYSWADAWNIIKKFPATEFTLVLCEDVTLSSSDASKLALLVNVTVDLAGFTLDSTAISNLINLDTGTNTSTVKFITSKANGTLNAKSVFFASSGAGTTLNLSLGGENSLPLTVNANYLVYGDNNFKTRAKLNFNINEGTYTIANSILRVDNYNTLEERRNTYLVNVKNANIILAASPVVFRTAEYCANSSSEFKAVNSSFSHSGSAVSFFNQNSWYGKAEFEKCAFNGITFDAATTQNTSGIVVSSGCSFKNSDATFNSEKTAFASEKVMLEEDNALSRVDDETIIVYDTLSQSNILKVAKETDKESNIYSWKDAWSVVTENTNKEYTLRLREDITLASDEQITLPAATSVSAIVDLAGYTLDSTALSYLIYFGNNSVKLNSNISFITTKSGGKLVAEDVFYLTPGTADTFHFTFGGNGSEAIDVKATYIANSTNNFKNASNLYINLNKGNYEFSTGIFDVDNYKASSSQNNYYINTDNADISLKSSAIIFKDTGFFASANSTIKAISSSFNYIGSGSNAAFFAKDQWLGSCNFENCVLNGFTFAPAQISQSLGILFKDGCEFINSDATFNASKDAFASEKASLDTDCRIVSSDNKIIIKKLNYATIDATVINGDSIIINGNNKGLTSTENYLVGQTLELTSVGEGAFLYWIDVNSNTILTTDENYSFTVGTSKNIAAVYADNSNIFVTFTSMANKLVAMGPAESTKAPADPYIYGYKFNGWYIGNTKTDLKANDSVNVNKSTDFRAGFIKDETEYLLNINGEEYKYSYNEKVLIKADAQKDGKAFSYWERDGKIVSYNAEYSFYVSGNMTVNAVYGKEITSNIILVMAAPVLTEQNKIAFFAERDITTDYEVIETGILMGTAPNLTVENATYKASAKSITAKGQFTVRKKNVSSGETYYACAYAICRDKNGNLTTLYSNEVSYTVK